MKSCNPSLLSLGIVTFFIVTFNAQWLQASATPSNPFRVVLDPGHGGSDEGTVYQDSSRRISEKQLTLLLALETAAQLRMNGIEVVLTRTTDLEVPLPVRTALANRLHADFFLSIHMNSTSHPWQKEAEGIETYILNNTTDASSRRLAQLENSVLNHDPKNEPYSSDVALILKDLRLDANLSSSKALACAIQESIARKNHNRGVKQALFHVLLGADMPSALLEAGFLTSPTDRARVLSPAGRRIMAGSIAQAISRFQNSKNFPQNSTVELNRCKVN